MGDFINKLQEEPVPENGDFLVFDIIDVSLGQFSTKKISYQNFSKILSGDLFLNTQSNIDKLSSSVSDFQSKLLYKLDKRGLSYNLNERMTGSLNVNSVLSCFEIAHFNKDLNCNVNKIINLSAQSFNDYDGVNKQYVDNLFYNVPVVNMSLFVLKSGDRMTGYLNLTSSVFNTNDAINKKYVDDIFIKNTYYLPISGGLMSGYLNVLNPLRSNHTASKEYVDSLKISSSDYLQVSGGSLSSYLTVLYPTISSHVSNKLYVDDFSDKYVKLNGSKVTPNFVTLNYSLTNASSNWAITKQYVDDIFEGTNLYVPISGNKLMSGNLTAHNIFSQNNEVVNKSYVDKMISTENVKLSGDTASNIQLKRFTEKLTTINHTTESNIILNSKSGNSFFINLNANCTGFDVINISPNNVYYLTLSIVQKKTVSPFATVNWSVNGSTILWEKGNTIIPSITQIADKVDVFTLIHKKGTWYGINAGQNR
jgi:hypothetical protein